MLNLLNSLSSVCKETKRLIKIIVTYDRGERGVTKMGPS